MTDMWLSISANDLLFFRGSEPFNLGETGYVRSEFPPSPQVMQGALRTGLLDANGLKLTDYLHDRPSDTFSARLFGALGRNGNQQTMEAQIQGPFLLINRKLHVPAPLDLRVPKGEAIGSPNRLVPGDEPVQTDLGNVRLPVRADGKGSADGDHVGDEPTDMWISLNALGQHLAGERIDRDSLIAPFTDSDSGNPLIEREPKVGLGRERDSHVAQEGQLYNIEPLRFSQELQLVAHISNLPDGIQAPSVLTLGGEGRFAWVQSIPPPELSEGGNTVVSGMTQVDGETRFRLVLLQQAIFENLQAPWLPDGLTAAGNGNGVLARGSVGGVECELVSACIGKPKRVGGWDIAANRAKSLRACVPAGSVYFFQTQAGSQQVVDALYDSGIGALTHIGFGHCLVGGW